MIRWTPPPALTTPQRWQSREEILKSHLDSLSSDELMRVRPYYWALRFGPVAWSAHHAKAGHPSHYNPEQPRVAAGDPDGGQWTSVAESTNTMSDAPASFALASRRNVNEADCDLQYKLDTFKCI